MRRVLQVTVLAALLLLGGAYFLHTQFPVIEKALLGLTVKRINSRTPFEIRVGAVTARETGAMSLLNAEISDASGLLLTLERLNFSWSPLKLLSGELSITRLDLVGVAVIRLPRQDRTEPGRNPLDALQRLDFNWLRAPLPVTVKALRLERVSIAGLEVSGKADLALAERLHVAADLKVMPHPDAASSGLRAMLGEAAQLRLAISERTDRELEISHAELHSAALAINASGRLAAGADGSDLALSLAAGPALAALVDGVLFKQIRYQGKVTGPMDSLVAEGQLEINELASAPADMDGLTLDTLIKQTPKGLAFNVSGEAEALRLARFARHEMGAVRLAATGNLAGGRLALELATLESGIASLRGAGAYEWADRSGSLAASVAIPDLAPMFSPYDLKVQGEATVNADLRLRGNTVAADTVAQVQWLKADRIATGPAVVSASISQHFSSVEPAVAGADGPVDGLSFNGQARISTVDLNGRRYEDLYLEYNASFTDTLQGEVSLTVQNSWLGAAGAATRFRYAEGRLALSDVRLEALDTVLEGQAAAVNTQTGRTDGVFRLASSDLGPLSSLAGLDAAGRVNGEMVLSHDQERQQLNARLELPEFSVAGNQARKAVITFDAQDLFGMGAINLALTAGSARLGDVTFDSLQATAAGRPDNFTYSVSAASDLVDYPADIRLAGHVETAGNVAEITLSSASLLLGSEHIRLHSPVAVRLGGGRVDDVEFELVLASGGNVTGNLNITPDGIHGAFLSERLPVSTFNRFARIPVSAGYLDLDAWFDSSVQQTQARLRARGRDLALGEDDTGKPVDVDLEADWDGERLALRAELTGGFAVPARARLALGAGQGKYGLPVISGNGTLEGALVWRGRLDEIRALVPLPGHQFDGDIDLDLQVAGTMGAPQFRGRGELAHGEYQNVLLGVAISDIKIRADAGDGARIDFTCEATDTDRGRMTGTGKVQWQNVPLVDAEIRIEQATLVRRDDITARISGRLALAGPFDNPALTGEMHIDDVEIGLLDFNPLEVVELEGIAGDEPVVAERRDTQTLSLDLSLQAKRGIFVRGRGLDSEWSANLAVTGDAGAPVLLGAMDKIRGQIDILGKPLELTRGKITFDGGSNIDPLLDVALERTTADLHGGMYLGGRVSAPRVHFASRSGLPEDEVLPRLLFGVARQSLTVTQALRLSAALSGFFGDNAGLQDHIRAATRLDSLQIHEDSETGAYVTLGKNLGERVFVGARQDIGGRGSSFTVEVEVTDRLIMDSEVTADDGSNIGLKWHWDF